MTRNSLNIYQDWQNQTNIPDILKILKKINALIKAIQRTPYEGIGKPVPLKFELAGYWSRRIDIEHRLGYQVSLAPAGFRQHLIKPPGRFAAVII